MSTMTEVVAAHYYMDDSKSHCECGYYAEWTPTSHAEHVAAELTKAGSGKLAEARAAELEAAAEHITIDHISRALRARADAIRAGD